MLSLTTEANIAPSLNAAYLRLGASQAQIDHLKFHLADFFSRVNDDESEEYLKNLISDFLKNTWYKGRFEINTKERKDLVIHNGKSAKDSVGVIVETKKANSSDSITAQNPNTKALHELILYYFDEREQKKNIEIKYLVATTGYEWFLFDENAFDKTFYRNAAFKNLYKTKTEQKKDNPFFYKEAAKIIQNMDDELPCTFFNLNDFKNPQEDILLLPLYKILSPEHLLKQPFANDSNSLNQEFYNELLHIMGLEEIKQAGKKIIVRQTKNRNAGSLIENTINLLTVQNKLAQIPSVAEFGDIEDEQLFSIGLELVITWLNRILFLKLLEGQLIKYHKNAERHTPTNAQAPAFLHSHLIKDFNDLDELFFEVLAIETHLRSESVLEKFGNLPYLNSSLFEETELELQTFHVNSLKHRLGMPYYEQTVLKDIHGKTLTDKKGQENQTAASTLDYLFQFLDAYDFSSEQTGQIYPESKTLINAAVLGLIFEKLNGYKDGSFFTPGFITMYMCRETIARAVLQKFSKHFAENFQTTAELRSYIAAKMKWSEVHSLNSVFNQIRICDPAVGSGHFLVSALNELIALKSELGILVDKNNEAILSLQIKIDNDELEILEFENTHYEYNWRDKRSQTIQETLFYEKQTLIENCLFGVDINPKSVMICRLRLWIELLKNSPLAADRGINTVTSNQLSNKGTFSKSLFGGLGAIQTLPNIDINIKCGNSLISRFDLKNNFLSKNEASRKKQTFLINQYKEAVWKYKTVNDKKLKMQITKQIKDLKEEFKDLVIPNDADYKILKEHKGKLDQYVLSFDPKENEQRAKLLNEIVELEKIVKEKQQSLYGNAFEWRFEFPEVLDENGDFMGFDVVVANPPYISANDLKKHQNPKKLDFYKEQFATSKGTVDLYVYFFEKCQSLCQEGFLSFITPNRYLSANYGEALRNFIYEKYQLISITDYSEIKVFKEASTYPIVTVLRNSVPSSPYTITLSKYLESKSFDNIRMVGSDKLTILENNIWGFLLNEKLAITEKIINQSVLITKLCQINATSTAAEADEFHNIISETSGIRLVNTGTIDRYSTSWGKTEMIDKGRKYLTPYLEINSGKISPNRKALYESPKIIFAKIALFCEAFLDENGDYASINTNCFHSFSSENSSKYILSWVNSKLFQFTFKCFFEGLKMQGGYLLYNAPALSKMCIKELPLSAQQPFINLVDQILVAKKADPKADTLAIEAEIDQRIYELYNLSPEEIAVVEESYQAK